MKKKKNDFASKLKLPTNGPLTTLLGIAIGLSSLFTPTIGDNPGSLLYHSIDFSALGVGVLLTLYGIRLLIKTNYHISIWRFLGRFILSGIISIVFGLLMMPFLTEAGGKTVEEMAKIGAQNMWRVVILYGLLTGLFTYFSYQLNKLRMTSLFLLFYWILGTTLVFSVNINNNKNGSNTQIQTTNRNNCNEQETLVNTKNCTVLVIRNDEGHGTAFSIKPGYLVTNKHVIEGAKSLKTWWKGAEHPLTVWNYSDDDLAILKTDQDIPACNWSNSNDTELAGTVFAVGWPVLSYGDSTITKGIFSRLMDTEEGVEFVQTDASINPGNSGGPLIDKCGIIGINNQKIVMEGVDNFAFAISSNYAENRVDKLITEGSSSKKFPGPTQQIKYNPDYASGSNSNNYKYSSDQISGWTKALNQTREMKNYWNNVSSGNYDQNKLNELKDLIVRMSAAVEAVVPKMQSGQSISNAEDQLLANWNNMINKAIQLEGELDGHSYSGGYYHYECQNYSCSKIYSRGKNACSSYSDCSKKYHYTCQNNSCMYVEGDGENECYLSSDCYHSVCDNGACKQVSGGGTSDCYTDYDCYHSECQGTSCVKVNSPGTTTCYSNYSCGGN